MVPISHPSLGSKGRWAYLTICQTTPLGTIFLIHLHKQFTVAIQWNNSASDIFIPVIKLYTAQSSGESLMPGNLNIWYGLFKTSLMSVVLHFKKDTYYAFYHFPVLQCFICSCAFLKLTFLNLKRPKSASTKAPLSYRKHCSWNASSVAPPVTLWHHTMSPSHTFI